MKNMFFKLLTLVVVGMLALSACGSPATATPAVPTAAQPTAAPAATSTVAAPTAQRCTELRECPALIRIRNRTPPIPAPGSRRPGVWSRHTVTNVDGQGLMHGATRHNCRHNPAHSRHNPPSPGLAQR